jgi:transcriptional regulator with XRE-family HTH domain
MKAPPPPRYSSPARDSFDPEILATRLREVREARGWSQKDLSQQTDLSPDNISHFECGRRVPAPANLFALAAALLVSPSYLLGYHD